MDKSTDLPADERPPWLAQFNALGALLDTKGIAPLDEASLLDQARRNTGLEDFGDDGWLPHFRTLIGFIEAEARLNFIGRILTRSDLLIYLEARLQVTNAYKQHPEIDDEVIKEPVFILGSGRSGTTILHEVLSQDPQFRSVRRWEGLFPWPAPEAATYDTDARIAKAQGLVDFVHAISPEWQKKHAWGARLPVEDIEFTYPAFMSEVWQRGFQIPSWERYFQAQDPAHHFAWHKKTLKLLQWKFKKPHWLLKNPTHVPRIPWLLQTYPDAKLLFIHRDPVTTEDSGLSVMTTIYSWRTDEPWSGGIGEWMLADSRADVWDKVIDWIDTGIIRKGNYTNCLYQDFMRDAVAMIERAYGDLGLPVTAEALERMRSYLANRPQGAQGKHSYKRSVADEAAVAERRRVFRRYQDYFKVPNDG